MNRLNSHKNVVHYSVSDLATGQSGAIAVSSQNDRSKAKNQSFYIEALSIVVFSAAAASFMLVRLAAFFPN
jgi:hypothetical protein